MELLSVVRLWLIRLHLQGESEPVRRGERTTVFAGTVVEEGEIVFRVKSVLEAQANTSSQDCQDD